jgi:hypothetical protein
VAQGDVKKAVARPSWERAIERVMVDDNGCWLWSGAFSGSGYGQIREGSRSDGTRRVRHVHIVMWEHFEGPVPDGLELDHLCRVRECCNPGHLELVTHQENMRRMVLTDAERQRRSEWASLLNQIRWSL